MLQQTACKCQINFIHSCALFQNVFIKNINTYRRPELKKQQAPFPEPAAACVMLFCFFSGAFLPLLQRQDRPGHCGHDPADRRKERGADSARGGKLNTGVVWNQNSVNRLVINSL